MQVDNGFSQEIFQTMMRAGGTSKKYAGPMVCAMWRNGGPTMACGRQHDHWCKACNTKPAVSSKGLSGVALGRYLAVGQTTAWFLGHRIRAMMEDKTGLLRQSRPPCPACDVCQREPPSRPDGCRWRRIGLKGGYHWAGERAGGEPTLLA